MRLETVIKSVTVPQAIVLAVLVALAIFAFMVVFLGGALAALTSWWVCIPLFVLIALPLFVGVARAVD